MTSRRAIRGSGKAGSEYMRINETNLFRHLSTTMQIVEKKALPLYKMKLWSLELGCESVPAISLAASILLVFPHFPGTLVSLSLTSLPRITQLLLKEIARRCMSLKELELSVVQRLSTDCCWACFEESSSCIEHSPIRSDASCDTTGDLAVGDWPLLHPRRRLIDALLDVLRRVPSTSGKPETPLRWGLPLLSSHFGGTHRQPLLSKGGLPTHRVYFGRFVLCPPRAHRRWPGGTSPSTFIQKIGRR